MHRGTAATKQPGYEQFFAMKVNQIRGANFPIQQTAMRGMLRPKLHGGSITDRFKWVVCRWVVAHTTPVSSKLLIGAVWEGYGSYPPLNYLPVTEWLLFQHVNALGLRALVVGA